MKTTAVGHVTPSNGYDCSHRSDQFRLPVVHTNPWQITFTQQHGKCFVDGCKYMFDQWRMGGGGGRFKVWEEERIHEAWNKKKHRELSPKKET